MKTATHFAHTSAARRPREDVRAPEVIYAAHTYATAVRLRPLIEQEFGDTPDLQAGRRAVLARDSAPVRRNR